MINQWKKEVHNFLIVGPNLPKFGSTIFKFLYTARKLANPILINAPLNHKTETLLFSRL